jgi:hypothetical protein
MAKRIREHLRSNVVGYVAIFLFAIGGTAYATHPGGANTISSGDIIDEQVKAADIDNSAVRTFEIRDGDVKGVDIADSTIASVDIQNGQVRTADVADDTTGGALTGTDIANTNSLGSPEIGGLGGGDVTDNSLTGADVDESSLNLSSHFAAGSATGSCNDDGETGTACASTSITLDQPGRLLLNGSGEWYTFALDDTFGGPGAPTDLTDRVHGRCELRVDGGQIGASQNMGEFSADAPAANHPFPHSGAVSLTALSGALGAGAHTVDVFCTEVDGDLDWTDINLTAIRADD